MTPQIEPSLRAQDLDFAFGQRKVLHDVHLELYPGEVLAIVGESGSGKSTLLRLLHGDLRPSRGVVEADDGHGRRCDLAELRQQELRQLQRSRWALMTQNSRDSLRMQHSAGANIIERRLAQGERSYARLRAEAKDWLARVEIDPDRIDDTPQQFSGGMLQRLQLARVLISRPSILLLDEPTSGLDLSVQAAVLDLIRKLVQSSAMAVALVTHDLGVARLLAQRLIILQGGRVVEAGLVDQVLEDPQHPYSQLLVASVLTL
ncbi:ATP-binding cassette domain-containing protein [Acidithiobacillus sp. CV18-2]|uniref:ATP-binding cassette domain-containing protein n=1 Tax=Igneacidithiobacillus copahuensis TaxID=2724909 RepID=A0AAE2YS80_9PROT|nr:ATP-binding cassette domain-containing protein [Igneacidithiobacillus copahuensis]MBU2755789.1 ATP-binding cassette domain-containing protein [Acidithiobacillus sp. CV18-3]MBU2757743.1 ATP-binding cassette domain-containing protein [Acidithiobacillus sp. BN09-2]MBU2777398.1 ATP-binding cassette domain-containing protein [Acidithiobacillus sp. CV18-2]MBU2796168.1 ATP-binding cassette domain-containing protein [Acidithiobacillus sp. VAN18-2]MBU2798509.1 ATP-binding cassette domain-containing 